MNNYTPRAPFCGGTHSDQRYFGSSEYDAINGTIALGRPGNDPICYLRIFRFAGEDLAKIELKIGIRTAASIDAEMTATELRNAAACLLDAAHDLEMHPAESLIGSAA